jgi:hypothetical protein
MASLRRVFIEVSITYGRTSFLFAKRATLGVAVIPHYSDDAPAKR